MECDIMVNVKTYHCFPTLIYEFKGVDKPSHLRMLNILDFDYEKGRRSFFSYKQHSSPYPIKDDLYRHLAFKPLAKIIMKYSKDILKESGYIFDKIEMTSMWGNDLRIGDAHPPHTHSNNTLSGVYYLRASKNTSPIQFFDPRPQASVFKPRNKPNWNNANMIQFDSVEGVGFIFPAWLMHWVPPTDAERVSISWNVIVRGDYGEPNTLQNAHI